MLTLEQIRKAQVTAHSIKLDNLSLEGAAVYAYTTMNRTPTR
jgi:hypothetical protein